MNVHCYWVGFSLVLIPCPFLIPLRTRVQHQARAHRSRHEESIHNNLLACLCRVRRACTGRGAPCRAPRRTSGAAPASAAVTTYHGCSAGWTRRSMRGHTGCCSWSGHTSSSRRSLAARTRTRHRAVVVTTPCTVRGNRGVWCTSCSHHYSHGQPHSRSSDALGTFVCSGARTHQDSVCFVGFVCFVVTSSAHVDDVGGDKK